MRACNRSALMRISFRADPTSRSSKLFFSAPGVACFGAGEPHLAIPAPGAHPARQVDPAPPAPAGDQVLDPLDVPGGQGARRAARHDRGVAQDAGPYRCGEVFEIPGVEAGRVGAVAAELSAFREREVIEAFGVGAQLAR